MKLAVIGNESLEELQESVLEVSGTIWRCPGFDNNGENDVADIVLMMFRWEAA